MRILMVVWISHLGSAPASEVTLSDVCLPIDGPANTANVATRPRLDNCKCPPRISVQTAVILNEPSTPAADTAPVA